MRFHITRSSTNRKTGPIPVVTVSSDTCPSTCTLRGQGCYAEGGPLAIHWRKITEGKIGIAFKEFLTELRKLPKGQLWRYGQAGDLPPKKEDLLALAKANQNRPVIAYTHGRNFEAYREAAKLGFHINLSADNLNEADTLSETGLSVVTVLGSEYERRKDETISEYRERLGGTIYTLTPKGRTVIPCPATYADNVSCVSCQLCKQARANGVIIGFPAHGNRKKMIDGRMSDVSRSDPRPSGAAEPRVAA